MKPVWTILIFYAFAELILIYTYQFSYIRNKWENLFEEENAHWTSDEMYVPHMRVTISKHVGLGCWVHKLWVYFHSKLSKNTKTHIAQEKNFGIIFFIHLLIQATHFLFFKGSDLTFEDYGNKAGEYLLFLFILVNPLWCHCIFYIY